MVCARAAVALLAAAGAEALHAATPMEVWPAQVRALNPAELKSQLDAISVAAPRLPEAVQPAAQFQKVFLQMISGVPKEAWRAALEEHAQHTGGDAANQALAEVAKVWLARVQMQNIDSALRRYYRMNVRFPDLLSVVMQDTPASLQKDPWGQTWAYQLKAPAGFPKQKDQRYQLGPTRFPQLATFVEATRKRTPAAITWKISPSTVGGSTTLEFRAAGLATPMAVLQPGGTVGGYALMFVGNRWALMASQDQLFAVAF